MTSRALFRTTLRLSTLALMCAASIGTQPARGQAGATPAAAAPQAAPAETAKPDDKAAAAKETDCAHLTAVLAGRKKGSALFETKEVQALARKFPELVTCGAVAQDSDELCTKIFKGTTEDGTKSGFVPDGPYKTCREGWSTFHEMRANPTGRGFMFSDVNYQNCMSSKEIASYCPKIRNALRSGDANQCKGLEGFESMCRAYMNADKSLCAAPKGNAFLDKHGADIAKDCVQQLESKAPLVQGLKTLAASGPAPWRELAKAALKESDACETYVKAAIAKCSEAPPPAPPAGAPGAAPPAGKDAPAPADGKKS